MASSRQLFNIKGMQKDITPSKSNSELAYDNYNIRLTPIDGNNLYSMTNERGTLEVQLSSPLPPNAKIIGDYLLGTTLILFILDLTTSESSIYRLEPITPTSYNVFKVYSGGNLEFGIENPIKAIGINEGDKNRKLYFVDGIHPTRVVNIDREYKLGESLDFVRNIPKINLQVKKTSTSGNFPSGVLQYALTLYYKFGPESKIVGLSPLLYTNSRNKGGSSEEKSSNSFLISISNIDTIDFDHIRIYSIMRTSIDATPSVKVVTDLKLDTDKSVVYTYIDSNTTGYTVDPTILYYVGGQEIIPSTIAQKDNTLFLGNYKILNKQISPGIKDYFKNNYNITYGSKKLTVNPDIEGVFYPYTSTLDKTSEEIKYFRKDNIYRFGVQIGLESGEWSEPLFIDDITIQGTSPATDAKYNVTTKFPKLKYDNIPTELQGLFIRPIVVYPKLTERVVVSQGIVCPTVYDIKDRKDNLPYAISSWFARPLPWEPRNPDIPLHEDYYMKYGTEISFRHNRALYPNWSIGAEIQSQDASLTALQTKGFAVDQNIITFHSPEIEFNDDYKLQDSSQFSFKIIGAAFLGALSSDAVMEVSTPPVESESPGVIIKPKSGFNNIEVFHSQHTTCDYGGREETAKIDDKFIKEIYITYPWHRNGPVSGVGTSLDAVKPSLLDKKKLSNYKFCYFTKYGSRWAPSGISSIGIFDSNEASTISLRLHDKTFNYQANINKIVTAAESSMVDDGYYIYRLNITPNRLVEYAKCKYHDYYEMSKDPISIKYKSGKHAVFAFAGESEILPHSNPRNLSPGYTQEQLDGYLDNSLFWVGEFYNKIDPGSIFGGRNEAALLNNQWEICGPMSKIEGSSIELDYTEGDTYYQRYDVLKTYPYTLEDQNSVTEIVSFMCESYVNIDGRYDNNRGKDSQIATTPTVFNLFNPVYSQRNNYFTFRGLDQDIFRSDTFRTSLTWSKTKNLNEPIDVWTNVNLASNLNLDGDKGNLSAIIDYNNVLYAFQDKGISRLLFNSRVQVPTTEGVPIEISNSYKMDGKIYIHSTLGTSNGWAIVTSPNGIYFIDSSTGGFYLLSRDGGFVNISDQLGFHSWINENLVDLTTNYTGFDPHTSKSAGTILYYDKIQKDIYITSASFSLAYSENLNQFTSFYPYKGVTTVCSPLTHTTCIKQGKLWLYREGDYNLFFNNIEPYYTTIIGNENYGQDKIFTGLEFRSSSTPINNILPFDSFRVWNDYQDTREVSLTKQVNRPSNTKNKFRIWRLQIPRAFNSRDRIRNPWSYIHLKKSNLDGNTNKAEIHDLVVHTYSQ